MFGKVFRYVSGGVDTFAGEFTAPMRTSEVLRSAVRLKHERALVCLGICLCIVVRAHPVLLQFGSCPKIGVAVYTAHYY